MMRLTKPQQALLFALGGYEFEHLPMDIVRAYKGRKVRTLRSLVQRELVDSMTNHELTYAGREWVRARFEWLTRNACWTCEGSGGGADGECEACGGSGLQEDADRYARKSEVAA